MRKSISKRMDFSPRYIMKPNQHKKNQQQTDHINNDTRILIPRAYTQTFPSHN